jgi:hypothetical protein
MLKVKRYFFTIISVFILAISPVTKAFAAEPSFSFYPDSGVVANLEDGFTVDVMIDTAGQEVTSARFTITFDPNILQLAKAERNNSLFEQYPDDESSLDNTNGVVMLTGFTQSGSSDLYVTEGDSDLFARLTFDVLKKGEVTLDWEFTGSEDLFDTYILEEGSPPQNILDTKPSSATFEIGDIVNQPDTAIGLNEYIIATGFVLILFGALIIFSTPKRRDKGTVVLYEG